MLVLRKTSEIKYLDVDLLAYCGYFMNQFAFQKQLDYIFSKMSSFDSFEIHGRENNALRKQLSPNAKRCKLLLPLYEVFLQDKKKRAFDRLIRAVF